MKLLPIDISDSNLSADEKDGLTKHKNKIRIIRQLCDLSDGYYNYDLWREELHVLKNIIDLKLDKRYCIGPQDNRETLPSYKTLSLGLIDTVAENPDVLDLTCFEDKLLEKILVENISGSGFRKLALKVCSNFDVKSIIAVIRFLKGDRDIKHLTLKSENGLGLEDFAKIIDVLRETEISNLDIDLDIKNLTTSSFNLAGTKLKIINITYFNGEVLDKNYLDSYLEEYPDQTLERKEWQESIIKGYENFIDNLVKQIRENDGALNVIVCSNKGYRDWMPRISKAIINRIIERLFNENWQEIGNEKIIEMLKILKAKGFDFNKRSEGNDEWNLLHLAVHNDNKEVFDWLIKNKADPKLTTSPEYENNNVIHIAIERNNLMFVRLLCESYPDLLNQKNKEGKQGYNPLHFAVRGDRNNQEIVDFLIDKTADKEDLFDENFVKFLVQKLMVTSLRKILKSGLEVNRHLFDYEKTKDEELQCILKTIAEATEPVTQEKIESIVDEIENIEILNSTLNEFKAKQEQLLEFARAGKISDIKKILDEGYKIRFSGEFAQELIQNAIKNKQFETAAFLISKDDHHQLNYDMLFIVLDFRTQAEAKLIVSVYQQKYLSLSPDAEINYLMSRISFKGLSEEKQQEFARAFRNFLSEEVSKSELLKPILDVLKFNKELKIIFDLSSEDVSGIDISYSSPAGTTRLKSSEIHIASNPEGNRQTYGTVIHEFCHQACQMLWKNLAIPYLEGDEEQKKELAKIIRDIKLIYDDDNKRDLLPKPIINVFKQYPNKQDWPAEIIVRIPHCLVCDGTTKLTEVCQQFAAVNNLFNFYQEKFIVKANQFVRDTLDQEVEKKIKKVNEITAELIKSMADGKITEQQYNQQIKDISPETLLDKPSATLILQSVYRASRVRKTYQQFREEDQQAQVAEEALSKVGYQSLNAVKQERQKRKDDWQEKIKKSDKEPPINFV